MIDIIDVAIVAFVVYQLLLLLRGRRAMQMLTSLFVIVVIGFVARWLQFDALNWLMSGLKGVWAIIFVILFQDELRRLLGQVGQSRFLRPFVKMEEHEAIDAIVAAAKTMSQKSTGALIVIERSARLINYYQTGVLLNATGRVHPSRLHLHAADASPRRSGHHQRQSDRRRSLHAAALPESLLRSHAGHAPSRGRGADGGDRRRRRRRLGGDRRDIARSRRADLQRALSQRAEGKTRAAPGT